MEEYLKGWKDQSNVYIPPVERRGFLQDIIIRNKVEPVCPVREEQRGFTEMTETLASDKEERKVEDEEAETL